MQKAGSKFGPNLSELANLGDGGSEIPMSSVTETSFPAATITDDGKRVREFLNDRVSVQ